MSSTTILRPTLLALLTLGATTCLTAQGSKVIPTNLTSTEGADSYYFPYIYNAGRFQAIWDGKTVCTASALINQISFRRDTNQHKTAMAGITRAKTTVSLGVTKVSPATMGTDYAKNIGGAKLTTLVNGLNFNLPAQPAPTTSPATFNIHYPLSTPFLFLNINGHLLMEWTVPGNATIKDDYRLDGETQTVATGYVNPFGQFGRFGAGDKPTFNCDPKQLAPGGALVLTVDGLKAKYPSAVFFGDSRSSWASIPLPLNLSLIGGNGSSLYTGRIIEAVMGVTQVGNSYRASANLAIPNNPVFAGAKMYAQSWFADPKANGLGVVTSNGLALTASTGVPYAQMIYNSSSTRATGSFAFRNRFGAPAVRLSGAIN